MEVSLQVSFPQIISEEKATCVSIITGIACARFECVASSTFTAVCGSIRLMKEWLIEQSVLGNRLWWSENEIADEADKSPMPLWLLFSYKSQMTDAEAVEESELNSRYPPSEPVIKTPDWIREHDLEKERLMNIRNTPITDVGASATYYAVNRNGSIVRSEIILERPFTDDKEVATVRYTMTGCSPKPCRACSGSTLLALMLVLRGGWSSLEAESKFGTSLYRDPTCAENIDASFVYNNLFHDGDQFF